MTTNQKEINIKKLIKDYTIETTPAVYEKYGNLKDFLPNTRNIYITYLPNEKPQRIVNTAKKLTMKD